MKEIIEKIDIEIDEAEQGIKVFNEALLELRKARDEADDYEKAEIKETICYHKGFIQGRSLGLKSLKELKKLIKES